MQNALAQIIQANKYPRMCIQVIVQVVHDDGSLLTAALNSAAAALLDASIAMNGMFAAATVALTKEGQLVIDPQQQEQQVCSTYAVVQLCVLGWTSVVILWPM